MTSVPKVAPRCDTWSPIASLLPFIHIGARGGGEGRGVIPQCHYQKINLNYKIRGVTPAPWEQWWSVGVDTEGVPRGVSPTLGCDTVGGVLNIGV